MKHWTDNELAQLLRPNVAAFTPYSSARDEFTGKNGLFLDANENSLGSPIDPPLNRYPDPYQQQLRDQVAQLFEVRSDQIVLGNGSDEIIDLLVRAFIRPGVDELWMTEPSYGMYQVSGNLQEAKIRTVRLTEDFELPDSAQTIAFSDQAKLFFLCSPNNPTGNLLQKKNTLQLLEAFPGVVVIDEAYIDFASDKGFVSEVVNYPNLVVLRTFSKAWGLAAARIGVGIMNPFFRKTLDVIKPPYNVNDLTARCALHAVENADWKEQSVRELITGREYLMSELEKSSVVVKVFPSDSNFILVRVREADEVYQYLLKEGIITRNRNKVPGCDGCLRITVGSREENETLLSALKKIEISKT